MKGGIFTEDRDIIVLMFSRSEKALDELNIKYGKICFNTAFNILRQKEEADECVNDSYLALWNSIPPENPPVLRAYLLKVVRNISLNRLKYLGRQKRKSPYYECLDELTYCAASEDTVEGHMDKAYLTELIEKFLRGLDKDSRMLFVRRYFYMDSYESLSRNTGLKETALRARLMRIRKKLKKYLESEGMYI